MLEGLYLLVDILLLCFLVGFSGMWWFLMRFLIACQCMLMHVDEYGVGHLDSPIGTNFGDCMSVHAVACWCMWCGTPWILSGIILVWFLLIGCLCMSVLVVWDTSEPIIKRNTERGAKRFGANLVYHGCMEQGHSSLTFPIYCYVVINGLIQWDLVVLQSMFIKKCWIAIFGSWLYFIDTCLEVVKNLTIKWVRTRLSMDLLPFG